MGTIPQPTSSTSPRDLVQPTTPTSPTSPGGLVLSNNKFNFSVTVPMPKRRTSRDSGASGDSLKSIRDEMIDGLHKMGSNVNVLKKGVHKIYEDLRPIPAYATPVKKGQNRQSVIENENVEITKDDDDDDPYETMTVRSNKNDDKREYDDVQTEFRSTFFGISKDHDDDSEEDTKSENSNEGDVT